MAPETVEKEPASDRGELGPSAAAPLPGPSTDQPPGVSFSELRSQPLSLTSNLFLWWRILSHTYTHARCLCGSASVAVQ